MLPKFARLLLGAELPTMPDLSGLEGRGAENTELHEPEDQIPDCPPPTAATHNLLSWFPCFLFNPPLLAVCLFCSPPCMPLEPFPGSCRFPLLRSHIPFLPVPSGGFGFRLGSGPALSPSTFSRLGFGFRPLVQGRDVVDVFG